jgi:tetratricopeptide (TPR) repeat protein
MRRTRLIPSIIVSLLFLIIPVTSSAKETWTRLQSKNFTVIGNGSEGDMRKLANKLEQFRHVISLLFPKTQIETPVPTTVVLFKSRDSFKPFKPLYKGKVKENVAGYFLPSPDGNYIALTSELGGASPYEVIFHEYEHFILDNNLPNAPAWLNEGLAEFYSMFSTSDDDQKAMLGGPIIRHISTIRSSPFLPLSTLLTVNRKSPYYNESSKVGIFYAESWALVHYLMLSDGGKRQPQLTKFIDGLVTGVPLEDNFRQSFQSDYKTIENELRAYMGKFTLPVLNISFTKQLDSAKETTSATLSEAEAEYYLGDLLLRAYRLDEAETRLQKSLALDANFVPAQISLGILRLRQKRLPEAKKILQTAVARDPQNYLANYYSASILRQEKQYEEALKAYQQATRIKPDIARTYIDLGYTYIALGRDEAALEPFKEAIRLDRRNPNLFWGRSHVLLRLARGSLAATDAMTYLRRQGWRDESAAYMALVAHFGYRQAGSADSAAKILAEASAKLDPSEWPYPIIRYLQGATTAPDTLALATDNDKLTEAHAYIGLDLSLKGEPDEALKHLLWVKENGNKNFVEYPLALMEINRIESTGKKQPQ